MVLVSARGTERAERVSEPGFEWVGGRAGGGGLNFKALPTGPL